MMMSVPPIAAVVFPKREIKIEVNYSCKCVSPHLIGSMGCREVAGGHWCTNVSHLPTTYSKTRECGHSNVESPEFSVVVK